MIHLLPSTREQLENLKREGEQFPGSQDAFSSPLPGVYIDKSGKQAFYDNRIIPSIPEIVAPSELVSKTLRTLRPNGITTQDAHPLIRRLSTARGLTIGFSGYGTEGRKYGVEHDAIDEIFKTCKKKRIPVSYITTGGTGYGVPGLAGALGEKYRYKTVGFAPLRSLDGAAPVDHLVVTGQEWGDEAEALGSAPDVLVALGGKDIAQEEVEAAIKMGTLVILGAVKKYPKSSVVYLHERSAGASRAQRMGRLIACKSIRELTSTIEDLDPRYLMQNRGKRQGHLTQILKPTA